MSNVPPMPENLRGAVDLSALVRRAQQGAAAPNGRPSSAAPAGPNGAAAGGTSADASDGSAAAAAADADELGGASAPAEGSTAEAGALVFTTDDAGFEQVLRLSMTVPVLVEFIAAGIASALGPIVRSYGGRLALAVVDAQANPQLAQAFQLREVPAVAAVVAQRPVNLFVGIPSDEEMRPVLDEVLQLAAQNGVTGTVSGDGEAPAEPEEEPLSPEHEAAYEAIASGDFAAAIAAYDKALKLNPRDQLAVAGRAQAALLQRLSGHTADAIRGAAAEGPDDVEAQLAVADLDVSGGHLDDAFGRLLDLYPSAGELQAAVRARLLEYFEIAGPDDERVGAARRRLASLLY
ncbi:MAG: tetratricopeptide repeat protein [Actinomycetales bacterium]|nr:tetratricopeptide repeat protein [Actinomycetales bacterium]